jgi:hypothetical protein
MIRAMNGPCWYLADEHGNPYDLDGTPHYPTEVTATARAATLSSPGRRLTPKLLNQPCIIVTCNGCDQPMGDGVWNCVHFDTEAEAQRSAGDLGWETGLGPNVSCPDCPVPAAR